jgi:hypothetical protein
LLSLGFCGLLPLAQSAITHILWIVK